MSGHAVRIRTNSYADRIGMNIMVAFMEIARDDNLPGLRIDDPCATISYKDSQP